MYYFLASLKCRLCVQMIIVAGQKPCMYYLALSSLKYLGGQCGVKILHHRDPATLLLLMIHCWYTPCLYLCVTYLFSIIQARVNIPAVGERTMRRDIATSQFTTGSEIQVAMSEQIVRVLYLSTMHIQLATLNEACKVHPNEKWWIKGDGCDLVSGLEESLKSEWHGDVDFGTGELQSLYDVYMSRLSNIDTLQHSNVNLEDGRASILNFLVKEQEQVTEDVTFIAGGMLIAILTELDT